MRVIAGTARGRRLKELEGMDTRPTTDKVKESMFNILQFDLDGRRVLDLFAGTGQLGIEALSRGADHAVFVERRADAVRLIRENLKATEFSGQAGVVQGDALEFLAGRRERFDIIVSNPPYIPSAEIQTLQREVKDYEPRLALDGGADGLDIYRRIAKDASKYLNRGGVLIMEVGAGQAQEVVKLFKSCAYSMILKDFNNIDR